MTTPHALYRERQLRSGSESGEIWYVSNSFVAGTSASLSGVPRHMYDIYIIQLLYKVKKSLEKRYCRLIRHVTLDYLVNLKESSFY